MSHVLADGGPRVSCRLNREMGELETLVQPPLLQAMQAYFGLPDDQLPVRLATLFNFDNLIIFSLQNMPKPNYQAVDDVRGSLENAGRFTIKDGSGNYHLRGEAHTEGAAKYFIHGTGVEEALSILTGRMIIPSEKGPAGRGVYALSIDSLTIEAIKTGWANVAGSGYCRGAALSLDTRVVVMNSSDGLLLPPCSAYKSILQGVALASPDSPESIFVHGLPQR